MSRETPAKSTDADKLVDCEGQGDLEDLADLANTYLLGPQDLTSDLTVRCPLETQRPVSKD